MIRINNKQIKKSKITIKCAVRKYTPVDKKEAEEYGLVRKYKNKIYYFCCELCLLDFDKCPKQYAR